MLVLKSNFDKEASFGLKEAMCLALNQNQALDIDASKVEQISSTGLQLIYSAQIAYNDANLSLNIISPSEPFLSAFVDAGLGEIFPKTQS